MEDDILKEKLHNIRLSLDSLRNDINIDVKLDVGVQHSIIWAATLILLMLIIKFIFA